MKVFRDALHVDSYCIALVSYVCIDCSKGVGKRITIHQTLMSQTKQSWVIPWKGSDEFACTWANYSDKTAGWSPQMVKRKGIHVLHCFCSDAYPPWSISWQENPWNLQCSLFIIPCHCHPSSSPSPFTLGICHDFALDVSDGHVFGGYIERFVHGLALWSILQYDATTVPRLVGWDGPSKMFFLRER